MLDIQPDVYQILQQYYLFCSLWVLLNNRNNNQESMMTYGLGLIIKVEEISPSV